MMLMMLMMMMMMIMLMNMMLMMLMLMLMMMMMMMMMRRPSSLRVRAKPRHLPCIYIYNLIPQQIPMVTKQHENHHLLHKVTLKMDA